VQAYGSDRLRQDGDRWILWCRVEKGWIARVDKAQRSAEFPGTAVLSDNQYFEVVKVDAMATGIRYVLEPWREDHAMRTTDRYDAESEAAREEHRRAAIAHVQKRHALNLLGIFAGHLPADVQEKLGMEYGVYAHWLTLMSTVPIYLTAAGCMLVAGDRLMHGDLPFWLIGVAIALLVETMIRSFWAFATRKPMGSLVGLFAYTAYAALTGTLVISKPATFVSPEAPEHIANADAIAIREPLITLLPRADQERITRRFPYSYERLSAKVAAVILVFAVIGAFSAGEQGHVAGALVAAVVAGEQIYRLSEFRRGPTGSMLGFLVRPVVRKLL
jgi:hypothetical protein